ncbi:hypothetical protein TcYC6_0064870 [Trypanosoma cruzi]|nr:hypothetical protein TcYC6_0064870 [Trypanosoma cruzi]
MLATAAPSNPPPPAITHRRCTAQPTLHPIFQIARRNRRKGQWSLSANDARLWYDEHRHPRFGQATIGKGETRSASRNVEPATREQRMSLRGAIQDFLPHARTADATRRAARPFGGNRSGAIDPTAVRQDAAVMLEMDRTPLDMMILGLQKIAARSETKQARP